MEINLGEVKENTSVKTSREFKSKKTVSYIDPSCGCMSARYIAQDNKIHLSYNAGTLDMRTIQTQGYQEIHKYLTVRYQDGTTERINIIGKIIKK